MWERCGVCNHRLTWGFRDARNGEDVCLSPFESLGTSNSATSGSSESIDSNDSIWEPVGTGRGGDSPTPTPAPTPCNSRPSSPPTAMNRPLSPIPGPSGLGRRFSPIPSPSSNRIDVPVPPRYRTSSPIEWLSTRGTGTGLRGLSIEMDEENRLQSGEGNGSPPLYRGQIFGDLEETSDSEEEVVRNTILNAPSGLNNPSSAYLDITPSLMHVSSSSSDESTSILRGEIGRVVNVSSDDGDSDKENRVPPRNMRQL